jgi:hypothetical protein
LSFAHGQQVGIAEGCFVEMKTFGILLAAIVWGLPLMSVNSFQVGSRNPRGAVIRSIQPKIFQKSSDDETEDGPAAILDKKASLEEKMKSWEATKEEQKAASLLGVVPDRSDAFDIGLYIAFPLMVGTGLLFAFFPLIMDKIDVSSAGPPPTM